MIESAIVFSVEKLRVSSIVVCGHARCTAIKALLPQRHCAGTTSLGDGSLRVLLHGHPALAAFVDGDHPVAPSPRASGFDLVDQLSMVNVATQVETPSGHPIVVAPPEQCSLNVTGLYFDIPGAGILHLTRTDVEAFTKAV